MSDAAFTGFLISLVAWLCGVIIVRNSRADSSPVSLIAWAAYAHVVIFVIRPFYIWRYGDGLNLFSREVVGDTYVEACVLSSIGWLAICVGYAWAGTRGATKARSDITRARGAGVLPRVRTSQSLPRLDDGLRAGAGPLLLLVILAGIFLYSQFVLSVGLDSYLTLLQGGRTVELTGALGQVSGYYTSGLQLILGAIILLLVDDAARGRKFRVFLWIAVLVVALVPQIASGSRSVFVPVLVAIVVIGYRARPHFFRPVRVIVGVVVGFVVIIILPRVARTGAGASEASVWENLRIAASPEESFTNFVGNFDTAMIDAFELQVGAAGSGNLDWENGRTYLSLVTSFVPRDLWADKPLAVDLVLNQALFPATASQKIGFSFGFYSEPYLNFGIAGVLLVSLLFGMVLGSVAAWRESDNLLRFWIYVLAAAYLFPVMRGSLSFDSQRFLVSALPALLAVYVAMLMGAGSQNRSVSPRGDAPPTVRPPRTSGGELP